MVEWSDTTGEPMCSFLRGVCLAIAGLGLMVSSLHAEGTGCKRYRIVSLPITYDRAGRPLIEAFVNGEKLHMLVDTGGIDSALTWATVERMKLHKEPLPIRARAYDVQGIAITYKTYADKFRIGVMSGTHWPFLVLPERNAAVAGPDIDGLLGPDILQKYDIEFDFAADRFNIFTHDECPGRVVYWSMQPFGKTPFLTDGYHMKAHARLDGEDVDVMIDTGASTTFLTDATARELDLDVSKMERINKDGDGRMEMRKYRFKQLDLNGVTVQNLDAIVIPERNAALHNMQDPRPTLTLGMTTLRQLHIYIAYRKKELYFTPAGAR